MLTTPIYYESHINVELLQDGSLKRHHAEMIARTYRMKISDMNGNDHLDDPKRVESILTGHSQNEQDLKDRVYMVVEALKACEVDVTRYKIEAALLDSRKEDVLSLL